MTTTRYHYEKCTFRKGKLNNPIIVTSLKISSAALFHYISVVHSKRGSNARYYVHELLIEKTYFPMLLRSLQSLKVTCHCQWLKTQNIHVQLQLGEDGLCDTNKIIVEEQKKQ